MTGIIIQSRLGSTRLPRKAFLFLGEKTVIEWVVDRCLETFYPVVLAVPEGEGDEFKEVVRAGVPVFEGHPTDVLDRYFEVAKDFKFDPVIRITGDCPLVDPYLISAMHEKFLVGYLSNCHPIRTVPPGQDVEIFKFDLLERAWREAKDPADREHVTKYIYEHYPNFCTTYAPPFPASWKTCIDTQEDYERVKIMVEEGTFPWRS